MATAALHILVPGLAAHIPGVERLSPPLSQPVLERFLSRADLAGAPGRDLESTLCGLFGIEPGNNGNLPLAALRRAGGGRPRDGRFWLQAEPVCLRPDQTRLLLFDTREFDVSADELRSLGDLFSHHFEAESWVVETDDPFCWFLSPESPAAVSSHSLGDVFGRNMDLFLPRGPDRLRWHGLLNEVQMLFFGSEVNQAREAAGKMPVGGLWFSGFGCLPEPVSPGYRQLYGDDALTAGLAELTATPVSGLRVCSGDSGPKPGASLAVYPHLQRPVWRADPFAWAEQVETLGAWLADRVDELRRGRLDELALFPCDGRMFRLDRRQRYRFWRASRPLSAWLQAES